MVPSGAKCGDDAVNANDRVVGFQVGDESLHVPFDETKISPLNPGIPNGSRPFSKATIAF